MNKDIKKGNFKKDLINLLNGVLHFGFTTLLEKWTKKEDDIFLAKKVGEKQNNATIMIL